MNQASMRLALVNASLVAGQSAHNMDAVRSLLTPLCDELEQDDIALLPEHLHFGSYEAYLDDARALAGFLGCHLVVGSVHRLTERGTINTGVVMSPAGDVLHRYDKLRPYATERSWVVPGERSGSFELGGRRIGVMICADFWFTDLLFEQARVPELLLVPALSVTRKPSPAYSQALWRHTAVARAYEYGLYVGISDWAMDSELPALSASGVAGFADPTTSLAEALFRPVTGALLVELDFHALAVFRDDRRARGFLWNGAESHPRGIG